MKPLIAFILLAMTFAITGCDTVPIEPGPYPIAKVTTRPKYPFEMRRRGMTGEAVVEFVVNKDGTVSDARVVRATTPEFGEAAVACIRQWKFIPAYANGVPVAARMQIPLTFTMSDDSASPI